MMRTGFLLGAAMLLAPTTADPRACSADVPIKESPPPAGPSSTAQKATAAADPSKTPAAKAKPTEAKPAESKPADAKSSDAKPADAIPADEKPASKLVSKRPTWGESLAEAEATARKSNRPLLVKVDATFCVWCKKLDEEFARAEPTAKLGSFVLVKLDAGRDADEAERLHVAGTPALRVLSPLGRLIASHDGFMPADELTTWLGDALKEATALPEADLASTAAPGALETVRIVRVFKARDVALREAALARLRPYPKESAPAVVSAFRDGNLQTRLAALELLRAWQAPTGDVDPWRPETLTKDRLAAVDEWVRTTVAAEQPADWVPTAAERAAAERDIDGLLTAGEADAAALRERLAKFGAHLLPSVAARLHATDDEALGERLSALRYRLVATQARVLDWPGGVERLASRNLEERRRAVDELARRAQSYDQALLLELFGDPDPLVRELSLRGLQTAAGDKANEALVKLLSDPEPNVRAAVLKQWAEKPTLQMLPELKKYVATERDADLLVHAVRVLSELKADTGPLLIGLMKHEAWQVRAEAAEVLAKSIKDHSSSGGSQDERKADAYAAFVERLGDEDGFVASRAVEGLRDTDLPAALKPLLDLAKSRPELAPAVIDVVVDSEGYRRGATANLREFSKHADPAVRAAAVKGLSHDATVDCEKELLAALADPESQVRIAAAGGVWNRARSAKNMNLNEVHVVAVENTGILEKMAQSILGGSATPAPQPKLTPPPPAPKETPETPLLRKMLSSRDDREAVAAGMALAGLGFAQEALDRLDRLVQKDPSLVDELSGTLQVLDWEHRLRMFRSFAAADPNEAAGATYYFVQVNDQRTAAVLWDLCRDPRVTPAQAFGMVQSFQRSYLGDNYHDADRASPAGRKRLLAEATEKLRRGGPTERAIALALLAVSLREDGLAAAADVLNADVELDSELRQLAFRIVLLGSGKGEADRAAMWALENDEPDFYAPALALLARDYGHLTYWKGHGYFLSDLRNHIPYNLREERATSTNPFDPTVPAGLTSAHLRRAAKSVASPDSGYVHYFRILLDESEDVRPLVVLWGESPDDATARRLLVRAIAYLDDPANIPILERVFAQMKENSSERGDFYWTIRIMNGPEILALRKRIRDEVGIDQLR